MRTLNRAFLAAGAAVCAFTPALASAQTADLSAPLAIEDVRHALTRTSFGASPSDLGAYVGQPRSVLVEGILDDITAADTQPRPAFTEEWPVPVELLFAKSETLGELAIGQQYINLGELSTWWMVEMMNSDSPFKEQVAMFWMDHFVTSFVNHEDSQMTAAKFQTVRDLMGGNFKDLLAAQLRDPSMLYYLNNIENTAEAPNENLGRELLELFTLGQGRGYTEADIREVSRALTGATVDADNQYIFLSSDHDAGKKTIFGQTGTFTPDDLPQLIMSQDAFGPYIVEKLWKYLVSTQPDPAQVAEITAKWKASNWDLPTLYRGVLESQGFWDPANHGTLVKSPMELYIGFARTFGTAPPYVADFYDLSLDGGQEAFMPPNVAGWDEGPAWITDATLAQRTAALKEMGEAWAFEDYAELAAEFSYADDSPAPAVTPETDGFRVGLSALEWAWTDEEDGWTDTGLSLRLFDVGFKGETYRSVGLWFGYASEGREGEPYLGLDVEGCGQGCPLSSLLDRVEAEEDDEGEVFREFWMNPWEMSDGVGKLSGDERDLLAAIVKALPALVEDTRTDQTWDYMAEEAMEEGLTIPTVKDVEKATQQMVSFFTNEGQLKKAIKAAPTLERGTSHAGSLGIPPELMAQVMGGSFDINDDESIDEIYGQLVDKQAAIYQARLSETFADPDQWFSALPTQAQTTAGLEIALLPVRNPALATGDKAVDGLEDLLFSLILDPRFQLK